MLVQFGPQHRVKAMVVILMAGVECPSCALAAWQVNEVLVVLEQERTTGRLTSPVFPNLKVLASLGE